MKSIISTIIITGSIATINLSTYAQEQVIASSDTVNLTINQKLQTIFLELMNHTRPGVDIKLQYPGKICAKQDMPALSYTDENNDGVIEVCPDLLTFARTDDQLACVIAHEMTHILRKHTERFEEFEDSVTTRYVKKNPKNKKTVEKIMAKIEGEDIEESAEAEKALVALLDAAYGKIVTNFAIDMEREADEGALVLASRAGFDPNEASLAMLNILDSKLSRQLNGQSSGDDAHDAITDRAFSLFLATLNPHRHSH